MQRYDELRALLDSGMNHSEAARQLGMPLRTVQRWLTYGTFPERKHRVCPSTVDQYGPYLERRYHEGCRNIKTLWQEVKQMGFGDQVCAVRAWHAPGLASASERIGLRPIAGREAATDRSAGLTLLLVAIGFYGVMPSRTARRKKEFGIRLALGATRNAIQALTLNQTGRVILLGMAPGAALSVVAVRYARHLLYGSVDANASAILVAALVLTMAGLIATLIPAHRAAYATHSKRSAKSSC